MKHKALIVAMAVCSFPLNAATDDQQLQHQVQQLQQQAQALQTQLNQLQKQLTAHKQSKIGKSTTAKIQRTHKIATKTVAAHIDTRERIEPIHSSMVTVHSLDAHPESLEFYPTALVADNQLVTYIAGTPVVSAPYLGSRPAFDGSDYIVNISSINRDIRLMQQRRRLERAYQRMGYPEPNTPIIALSGKTEPVATWNQPYYGNATGDLSLGSSELDVAAVLNDKVEAYIGIAYDQIPLAVGGQRLAHSAFGLNMGFVNIGNLDESPLYFTAGQLYAPFGRFSSSMVSAPLTMRLARTKSRPFILGYKSQYETGPFAAVYGFKTDTTLGTSGAGGLNVGYIFGHGDVTGEIGASVISTLNDSTGMQVNGSAPDSTFAGFASSTNGSELVHKIPALGVHGNLHVDRFNFTAEWVGALDRYRFEDLSFNNRGAQPQAVQLEAAVTFMVCNKPSSVAIGYQWSKDTLAMNLPQHRISGAFNMSIWKDTVESLEYRHDIDYNIYQYANGAAPAGMVNANTYGSGRSSDIVLAQIGVYF